MTRNLNATGPLEPFHSRYVAKIAARGTADGCKDAHIMIKYSLDPPCPPQTSHLVS